MNLENYVDKEFKLIVQETHRRIKDLEPEEIDSKMPKKISEYIDNLRKVTKEITLSYKIIKKELEEIEQEFFNEYNLLSEEEKQEPAVIDRKEKLEHFKRVQKEREEVFFEEHKELQLIQKDYNFLKTIVLQYRTVPQEKLQDIVEQVIDQELDYKDAKQQLELLKPKQKTTIIKGRKQEEPTLVQYVKQSLGTDFKKKRKKVQELQKLETVIDRSLAKEYIRSKASKTYTSFLLKLAETMKEAGFKEEEFKKLATQKQIIEEYATKQEEYLTAVASIGLIYPETIPTGILPQQNISHYTSTSQLEAIQKKKKFTVQLNREEIINDSETKKYAQNLYELPFKTGVLVSKTGKCKEENKYYQYCKSLNNGEEGQFRIIKKGHHTRLFYKIEREKENNIIITFLDHITSHQEYDRKIRNI